MPTSKLSVASSSAVALPMPESAPVMIASRGCAGVMRSVVPRGCRHMKITGRTSPITGSSIRSEHGVVRGLEAVLVTPGDRLGARLDADLPVGVADVALYGVDAEEATPGDLVVGETAGDEGQNLRLTLREAE